MLTKHNVCLFIKDEEHLEEMRAFLESRGETIDYECFYLDSLKDFNYLQKYSNESWYLLSKFKLIEISTIQFKEIFI